MLLAVGLSSTITPLGADTIGFVDFVTLVGASVLLRILPTADKERRLTRPAGVILALLYCAYMTLTIVRG